MRGKYTDEDTLYFTQNVYDKYSPQSINEQITESVWHNNDIHIEYIWQWLENGVRHIRDKDTLNYCSAEPFIFLR